MERSRVDRFCTRDCLPLAGGFDRFRDNGPRRRDGRDNAATELEENRFWASNVQRAAAGRVFICPR